MSTTTTMQAVFMVQIEIKTAQTGDKVNKKKNSNYGYESRTNR